VRSDNKNPQNYMLPGFVSPIPPDGKRHAAIIWLKGGDTNSLSDFWSEGPPDSPQSVSAFRKAGLIMAFPTLRGGNGHVSAKEAMLGEADDVIAAARKLGTLSYVDPEKIYLGGHSTGGTLALLVAELPNPFKSVFVFGAMDRADRYAKDVLPVNFSSLPPIELKLRSPIYWLAGIKTPTYIIEGASPPEQIASLDALCAATRNPQLHCIRVAQADHFSALSKVTAVIARHLTMDAGDLAALRPADFAD
jgi:dipeptidyl aminopeptidase/acylaminoacyl peptidase